MNKNKIFFASFIIIILLLTLFFCLILFYKMSGEGIIQTALMSIDSKISGKIIETNIENNKQVQKGEILVQIDSTKYRNNFKELSSQLEDLKIQNDLSTKEINELSTLVEQGKEELRLATLRLENANEDVVLYQNALKDGTVTNQDYKNALNNLSIAKEQFNSIQDELEENQTIHEELATKISYQAEELKALSDKLKEAELNLSYATILSPVDGVIINTNAKIGNITKENQTLASIVPNKCYILADFKTCKLFKIKPGQKVEIIIEQNKYDGKIEEIVSVGNKTTSVKIAFSQGKINEEVLAGMKAIVNIKLF